MDALLARALQASPGSPSPAPSGLSGTEITGLAQSDIEALDGEEWTTHLQDKLDAQTDAGWIGAEDAWSEPESQPHTERHLQGRSHDRHYALETDPLHQDYKRMLVAGTKPNLAKVTLARKIAAIALSMWKTSPENSVTIRE